MTTRPSVIIPSGNKISVVWPWDACEEIRIELAESSSSNSWIVRTAVDSCSKRYFESVTYDDMISVGFFGSSRSWSYAAGCCLVPEAKLIVSLCVKSSRKLSIGRAGFLIHAMIKIHSPSHFISADSRVHWAVWCTLIVLVSFDSPEYHCRRN